MKIRRFLKALLTVLIPVAMMGCATVDPRYDSMVGSAETNPKKDAIVGMWVAKDYNAVGSTSTRIESWLIRSNGTAIWRFSVKAQGAEPELIAQKNCTWQYTGGGLWIMKGLGLGVDYQLRLSEGYLLGKGGGKSIVHDRVE